MKLVFIPRKKRIKICLLSAAAILGVICLYLANRYLIPHVEVLPDVSQPNVTAVPAVTSAPDATPVPAVYDESNYVSENIEIHIQKVETGEGDDKVTYYVADVTLRDISYFKSAFAQDTFGRNITRRTSAMAEDKEAILAINGDYFGFRSDGVEIRNGKLFRDEPVRIGAAIYADGTLGFYDEEEVSSAQLLAYGVIHTISFGPVLVENGVAKKNFGTVRIDKNMGNRASISEDNPRTGIGMLAPNHFVFVVVDGRSPGYSRGISLEEFAQIFEDLGCVNAYNLDGGGSSTMYFMGKVISNPLGQDAERQVSDIFYIKE